MLEHYNVQMLTRPIAFFHTPWLNVRNYYPSRHECCRSSCFQIRRHMVLRTHHSDDLDPPTDDARQALQVRPRTASLAGRAIDGLNGQDIRYILAGLDSAMVEARSDQPYC